MDKFAAYFVGFVALLIQIFFIQFYSSKFTNVGAALLISYLVLGIVYVYIDDKRPCWRYNGFPSLPMNLAEYGIHKLSGDTSAGAQVRGRTAELPRSTKCVAKLEFNGQRIAKLLSYDKWDNHLNVHLLGQDVTGQPFLLHLPPNYWNRSIEECERWVTQTSVEDELIEA